MIGYFALRQAQDWLLDLLPPIYREQDVTGDLRAFLAIPAATLDEIKSLIDRLPDIWGDDATLASCRFVCDSRIQLDATRDLTQPRSAKLWSDTAQKHVPGSGAGSLT